MSYFQTLNRSFFYSSGTLQTPMDNELLTFKNTVQINILNS